MSLYYVQKAIYELNRSEEALAGWRSDAPELGLDHDWTLQLAPEDGSWRLKGRLPKGQLSARLQPVTSG